MRNGDFWKKIKKRPFFCLAPMANVTDSPFRTIITKYGKPDVMWTEFTSADGLCSRGKIKLFKNLEFDKKERPIVAQIFGANPKNIQKASKIIAESGFDGIDINMGCPDRKVEKIGAGAALIKNPDLAKKIIRAAISGSGGLPVSVKTRIGYNRDELENWLPVILNENVSAVIIHARTRKEMSSVPADWQKIKEAVLIRNKMKSRALIIGNGDVVDKKDGIKKAVMSGADGVMIGRAFFGQPWLLAKKTGKTPSISKKFSILIEHARLFEKKFPNEKNFATMRKHFKTYCSGFEGARVLRQKLMKTKNAKETEKIVKNFFVKDKKKKK